ncbi:hypothetical protein [Flavobacterium sp. N2270]|uniref:hypothetical protein n=1 Tax=Flavobacterium sp. N2270 TaxID=2986831 RepID=UPI0022253C0B|nr:hypothetical protein [Flavobacterium sp. N2270]
MKRIFYFTFLIFTSVNSQEIEEFGDINDTIKYLKDPVTNLNYLVNRVYLDSTKNIFICKDYVYDQNYSRLEKIRKFYSKDLFVEDAYNFVKNEFKSKEYFFNKDNLALKFEFKDKYIERITIYEYNKNDFFSLNKMLFSIKISKKNINENMYIYINDERFLYIETSSCKTINKIVYSSNSKNSFFLEGIEVNLKSNSFSSVIIDKLHTRYCFYGKTKRGFKDGTLKSIEYFDYFDEKVYKVGEWISYSNKSAKAQKKIYKSPEISYDSCFKIEQ